MLGSIWIPYFQDKLFTAIKFFNFSGDPDFVPLFYFLIWIKFGLYANLRASMQWNIKQEHLRTTSPKNDFAGCWDGGGYPVCCWRDAGPPAAGKRTMESLAWSQGADGSKEKPFSFVSMGGPV